MSDTQNVTLPTIAMLGAGSKGRASGHGRPWTAGRRT